MIINLYPYIVVSTTIFFLGIFGIILNKRSIILVLLCIELILLAVNLNFIFFSVYLNDFLGQIFALYVLTVAAAESAIGLAILVLYFSVHNNLNTDSLRLLHGLFNIFLE